MIKLKSSEIAYQFARVLRAAMQAGRPAMGSRWDRASGELSGCLPALASAAPTSAVFFASVCQRFGIDPASADGGRPVVVWDDGSPVPFFSVLARLPWLQLRAVIRQSPATFAAYATTFCKREDEAALLGPEIFEPFDTEEAPAAPFDLAGFTPPDRLSSVIVLESPLAHGADVSGSNVVGFRREARFDPLTGRSVDLPFVSGNSIRGLWRDLLAYDLCALTGVAPAELDREVGNAIFAGGAIDAGATMGAVDVGVRRAVRDLSPAWALLGGVVHNELMEGRLLVSDAVLVCRESAWLVAPALGYQGDARDLAASLPPADACTVIRQATRKNHADIPQRDGGSTQMIFHTEALETGCRLAHYVGLRALAGVPSVVRSALRRAIDLSAQAGCLGAKNAAGFGLVRWGAYGGGSAVDALPSADEYLAHVAARRDDLRAWLTGALRPGAAQAADAPPPSTGGKRGKSKAAPAATQEAA